MLFRRSEKHLSTNNNNTPKCTQDAHFGVFSHKNENLFSPLVQRGAGRLREGVLRHIFPAERRALSVQKIEVIARHLIAHDAHPAVGGGDDLRYAEGGKGNSPTALWFRNDVRLQGIILLSVRMYHLLQVPV